MAATPPPSTSQNFGRMAAHWDHLSWLTCVEPAGGQLLYQDCNRAHTPDCPAPHWAFEKRQRMDILLFTLHAAMSTEEYEMGGALTGPKIRDTLHLR